MARPLDFDCGLPGYLGGPFADGGDGSVGGDGWSSPLIAREKRAVADTLLEVAPEAPKRLRLNMALERGAALHAAAGATERLRAFLFTVSALRCHVEHGGLTSAQQHQLSDVGLAILKTQRLEPSTSKLSFLYGELHLVRAQAVQRQGKIWEAVGEQQLGQLLARRAPPGGPAYQALQAASLALRLGHAALAAGGFTLAEELGAAGELKAVARLGRLHCLRVSGHLEEAAALHAATVASGDLAEMGDETNLDLAWEGLATKCQREATTVPMLQAVARGSSHYQAIYLLEAWFRMRASPSKDLIARLPKLSTIHKLGGIAVQKHGIHGTLFECALALDTCYDNDLALPIRLKALTEALASLARLRTVEHELLVHAASARWLVRYHQPFLAALALAEYRQLSARLSDGRALDGLGLVGDIRDVDAWPRARGSGKLEGKATVQSVPTSWVTRASSMSQLAAKVAGKMALSKVRSTFVGDERALALRQEAFKELGEVFFAHLGRLKGPLMKMGQAASYIAGVPEDMRAGLAALQDASPPLAGDVARRFVEKELGRPVESAFRAWSDRPFATGSVGQLHRAELPDGRQVAVKVQYPDMEKVIDSDMKTMRVILPIVSRMMPEVDTKEALNQARIAMLRQCDYRHEARMQELYAANFRHDPDVLIPTVYHSHSSGRVLTSDFIDGMVLSDFAATAGVERRSWAGAAIFRVAYGSLFRHGVCTVDPHPGNYLFTEEQVCFLDFGMTQEVGAKTLGALRSVISGLILGDLGQFAAGIKEAGWAAAPEVFDYGWQYQALRAGVAAPWIAAGPMRYSREQVAEGLRIVGKDSPNLANYQNVPDTLNLDTLMWGIPSILADLGAPVDSGAILREILNLGPVAA